MKGKWLFGVLVLSLVAIILFTSCAATSTTTTSSTAISTKSSTTSAVVPPPEKTTATTTTGGGPPTGGPTTGGPPPATTSTGQAKWWETMWGQPEYGGTITTGANSIPSNFDPYNWQFGGGQQYEPLWIVDPTLDRKVVDLTADWTLYTNWKGNIAESWDWETPSTLVVHMRPEVHWQDKAPVNGRQFTADDVVWHFDRILGTGNGFTSPDPFIISRVGSMKAVTARDKSTVVFEFGTPSIFVNSEAIIAQTLLQSFECPEVYAMGESITVEAAGGPPGSPPREISGINSALNDWHNAVGTAAFMLTDIVGSSSVTYSRNPNYWAYDERYPENKLPYVDTLKTIFISDTSTSLAALRTGKIDMMQNIDWIQAETLKKSNPELLNGTMPQPGQCLCLRSDRKPFSDINVRKAMQLAIDLPAIAEGYYGGKVEPTPVGLTNPSSMKGFAIPYNEWPQDLKDEYSYNPEKAKQLMADAGYPNGFKVTCDEAGADVQLEMILKSYLMDNISVDMTIQAFDGGTLMGMMGNHKQDDIVGWTIATVMPPLMGMRMYVSTEPTNALENKDPVYDQMVIDCNNSTSVEEAQQRVSATDQYFLRQHWAVLTFLNMYHIFWQPYLKGYAGEKALTIGYNARYWIDSKSKQSLGR